MHSVAPRQARGRIRIICVSFAAPGRLYSTSFGTTKQPRRSTRVTGPGAAYPSDADGVAGLSSTLVRRPSGFAADACRSRGLKLLFYKQMAPRRFGLKMRRGHCENPLKYAESPLRPNMPKFR